MSSALRGAPPHTCARLLHAWAPHVAQGTHGLRKEKQKCEILLYRGDDGDNCNQDPASPHYLAYTQGVGKLPINIQQVLIWGCVCVCVKRFEAVLVINK